MQTKLKAYLDQEISQILLDPTFEEGIGGTSVWQESNPNWVVGPYVGSVTKSVQGPSNLIQKGFALELNKDYKISFRLLEQTGVPLTGSLQVQLGYDLVGNFTTPGFYETTIKVSDITPTLYFYLKGSGLFNGIISELKVCQVVKTTKDLDLFDDVTIPISFNIADLEDISKKNAGFSKTVTIPGTDENNKFFKHIYNITSSDTWEFYSTVDVVIEQDSLTIFEGVMELTKIIKEGKNIEYEVILYQHTASFYADMGSKFLTQNENETDNIDLSEHDHVLSYNNVLASIIDKQSEPGFGYTYIPIDKINKTQSSNNIGLSYNVDQLSPCLFYKEILDKIFEKHGYTYESNFFNSTTFKRTIYPFTDSKLQLSQINCDNQTARLSACSDWVPIPVDTTYNTESHNSVRQTAVLWEVSYNGAETPWDEVNGEFVAPASGLYKLKVKITLDVSLDLGAGIPDPEYIKARWTIPNAWLSSVQVSKVDLLGISNSLKSTSTGPVSTYAGKTYDVNNNSPFPSSSKLTTLNLEYVNDNLYLKSGEKIKIETFGYLYSGANVGAYLWEAFGSSSGIVLDVPVRLSHRFRDASCQLSCERLNTLTEGDTVEVNGILHKIKQADFISSLSKLFNLYWQPIGDKKFRVEPRNTFLELGTVPKDWTEKLSLDKEMEVLPVGDYVKKIINLTYEDDIDFYNVKYKELTGQTYGSYQYKGKYNKDESDKVEIKLNFAATPCGKINNNITMSVPKIFAFRDDGKLDINKKFKPRILLWQLLRKTHEVNGVPYKFHIKSRFDNNAWGVPLMSGGNYVYPFTSHFLDEWDSELNLADINFGQCEFYWQNTGSGNWAPSLNMVNFAYGDLFNSLFHPDSKLVNAYLHLTPQDIHDFKFYDIILIDGVHYRVNKIIDFVPGQLTKVELLKLVKVNLDWTDVKPPRIIQPLDNQSIVQENTYSHVLKSPHLPAEITGNVFPFDVLVAQRSYEGVVFPDREPTFTIENQIALDVVKSELTIDDENKGQIAPSVNEINNKTIQNDFALNVARQQATSPITPETGSYLFWYTVYAGTLNFGVPELSVGCPIYGVGAENYLVDWGDGTSSFCPNDPTVIAHTYEAAGYYNVKVMCNSNNLKNIDCNSLLQNRLSIRTIWQTGSNNNFESITFKDSRLQAVNAAFRFVGTELRYSFSGTNLFQIQSGFFYYCPNLEDCTGTFSNTKFSTLPKNLFQYCPNLKTVERCFLGCSNGSVIPRLFDFNPLLENVSYCFSSFGSSSSLWADLDYNLFVNNPLIEDFSYCFNNTQIQNAPSFSSNVNAKNFFRCFNGCLLLGLGWPMPSDIFDNCLSVEDFRYCFSGCVNMQGVAPDLWNRIPEPLGEGCFQSCVSLSNYASIPAGWK